MTVSRLDAFVPRVCARCRFALLALLALFALFALFAGAACREDTVVQAGYVGPRNACVDTCAGTAACVSGSCRAPRTRYAFDLEITPPTDSPFAPSVTFRVPIRDQSTATHDLALPDLARVRIGYGVVDDNGETQLIARAVTLTRSDWLPGQAVRSLSARWDSATTSVAVDAGTDATTSALDDAPLLLAPGDYDIDIMPTDDAQIARTPPLHLTRFTFAAGDYHYGYAAPTAVRSYHFALRGPDGSVPAARDVSLVDVATGRRVSTLVSTCGHEASADVVVATAARGPTIDVRVAPAHRRCASTVGPPADNEPTFELNLDALTIEGGTSASLVVPTLATPDFGSNPPTAHPRLVSGTVRAYRAPDSTATPVGVAATLVFRSRALAQDAVARSGRGLYVAQTTSGSTGDFAVALYPGTYGVTTLPDERTQYAPALTTVTVDGVALALDVRPRARLTGIVAGTDGQAFTIGAVDLAPQSTPASTGAVAAPVRAGTESLRSLGGIIFADPGDFDVVVRLPEPAQYPWIVAPRVHIPEPLATPKQSAPLLDLHTLVPTAPVVLDGQVFSAGARGAVTIAGALVRAKAAIVGADGTTSIGAVLAGETRTDAGGHYTLRLPESFTTLATGGTL